MEISPLKLGVAGLGRAFTLMLPTFLGDPRIRIVAGTDPRPEARQQFERDFGIAAAPDVQALCEDPAVEAVYIATPHQWHAAHVAIAAAAGRHILIEKPMAITLDECHAIVRAVQGSGVVLVVGHCHSFNAPVLQARRLIAAGGLGAVRMIHAWNYTDFLYRPRRPEELDTAQGGGVVFSQAAHQVDIVRLLGGGLVRSIRAHTGNWDPDRSTEGAYSALMAFEDGAFASLTYSGYGHYDSDEALDHIGELGARKDPAQYGAARRRLREQAASDEGRLKAMRTYGGPEFSPAQGGASPHHQHFGHVVISTQKADIRLHPDGLMLYTDEARRFEALAPVQVPRSEVIDELYEAIRAGAPVTHDARWARGTTEACLAILESARTQAEQPLRFQTAPEPLSPGRASPHPPPARRPDCAG